MKLLIDDLLIPKLVKLTCASSMDGPIRPEGPRTDARHP